MRLKDIKCDTTNMKCREGKNAVLECVQTYIINLKQMVNQLLYISLTVNTKQSL